MPVFLRLAPDVVLPHRSVREVAGRPTRNLAPQLDAWFQFQTSLNDLVLDEAVSEFKSLKLWPTVAPKQL